VGRRRGYPLPYPSGRARTVRQFQTGLSADSSRTQVLPWLSWRTQNASHEMSRAPRAFGPARLWSGASRAAVARSCRWLAVARPVALAHWVSPPLALSSRRGCGRCGRAAGLRPPASGCGLPSAGRPRGCGPWGRPSAARRGAAAAAVVHKSAGPVASTAHLRRQPAHLRRQPATGLRPPASGASRPPATGHRPPATGHRLPLP